jgi:two-component system, sensor histidine kinase
MPATSSPISELARESLADAIVRISLRVRTAQSLRTLPFVAATLLVLVLALSDSVDHAGLYAWTLLMAATTLARALTCRELATRVSTASIQQLQYDERWMWLSLIANTFVIGLSFWMVASTTAAPNVKIVITLMSCFYAIGSLVNASIHFSSFAAGAALNMGQGVAFWLGLGPNLAQPEVAVPYAAVAFLIIGFARDNSQQFQESLRIRKQNAELMEQLEHDKARIEQALGEAKAASESKSKFLAAASHDLRQPLHALTMFLGTMTFHVTTEDAKRLLNRIKETTGVLEEQFDSLLDLSKFDAHAITPEIAPFRLDRLIERLVEEIRPEAEAKQVMLAALADHAVALGDSMLVARVLRNLVGNAVKYTSVGSVTVSVQPGDNEFFIEVIDTGPGIPEDQQSRIFEEYVQLVNPARQRRYGVGLGLAIVKRIDVLLNLRLTLRSAVGFGSRFGFYVPRGPGELAPQETAAPVFDVTSFRTSARVWILDDDQNVLDGLREQLSAWGAQVEAFQHPTDLLEKLRSGSELPHWIFTDDMLGAALSGLETAQILASEFGFGRVCLLTGNTEPRRLAQLRSSGFPVLLKPAQPDSLVTILNAEMP